MAIPTCDVTCVMFGPDGEPEIGAMFEAVLDRTEVYAGFIVPDRVQGVTDESGSCVLKLWPNQLGVTESVYNIRMTSPTGKTQRVVAVVPNTGSANLHDVTTLPPYPGKQDGVLALDAALVAGQQALASADSAINSAAAASASEQASAASEASSAASAATATTKATESATSAAAALASANNAQAQAEWATTQSGAAAGSAAASDADRIAAEAAAASATASATTATTKASEAASSETSALSYKNSAEAAATSASGSAATATTKAAEASASADSASTSAATATTKAAEAQSWSQLIDPSNFVPVYASGVALPSSDLGPIWHDDYNSMMTWRTIGSYTGYASVNLGQMAHFDSNVAPAGWLKYAGQSLSSAYAALIQFRGSSTLVDGRGEFLRALDDGRGVDPGRVRGTLQGSQNLAHTHTVSNSGTNGSVSGATQWIGGPAFSSHTLGTSSSGGSEARPRNIPGLLCVKF